jgi:hypothetical protein
VKAARQPWSVREIALSATGNGVRRVGFSPGAVKEVDLVLANASTRMRCGRNTSYSCTGVGADDKLVYAYRGTVR